MIGDSMEHDVRAPRRQGFQTVWFDRRGDSHEVATTGPVVTDLRGLAEMIESVLPVARDEMVRGRICSIWQRLET